MYRGKVSFLPITKYIPKTSNNNNSSNSLDIPGSRNRRVSLHSLDEQMYQDGLDEDVKLRTKSMPSELFRAKSLSANLDGSVDVNVNGENLTDIRDSSVFGLSDSQKFQNSRDSKMSIGSENEAQYQNGEVKNGNFNLDEVEGEDNVSGTSMDRNTGLAGSSDSIQETLRMVKKPGQAVPSYLLPPLDQPVPDDWVTLDEDFVTVCAVYQTHLGSDVIMAPDAHFNDGLIQLVLIRSGVTKQQLFSLMTSLEKGSHVDNPSPYVEFIKVLAFRIEPEMDKEGVIMIDGEKVDYAPLQAQVLPGIANLMAIQ